MPRIPDRCRLLHGPYTPPALHVGDRTTCLHRDADVVITSWTAARISWPRCRALGQRGGSGLLVDGELARAVRCEAAAAIQFWWGVGEYAVWRWRQVLGVGRMDSEGSRRLILAAAEKGGDALRGKPLPAEAAEERRRRAVEKNLARNFVEDRERRRWKPEELAMLGTMPDEEVARRTGRKQTAVRVMRGKLLIPTLHDRRRRTTQD